MTERRITLPVRYSLGTQERRLFGSFTHSSEIRTDTRGLTPWSVGTPSKRFWNRAALSPVRGSFPLYSSGIGPVLVLPERTPGGLRSIEAVSVDALEPHASTSVLFRVTLGGSDYWWDGAAWSLATDDGGHWNTPAELETNLPSVSIALARTGIGFKVSLRTSRAEHTPFFYGVEMFWDIHMTDTVGARQGSARSELAVSLLRAFKGFTFRGSEVLESAGDTVVSYANQSQGDSSRDVQTVLAVYNATTDPELESALSGSWDAGTKRFTLDTAIPAGQMCHVDYEYAPLVSMGGDMDRVVDYLPAIIFRAARTAARRRSRGHHESVKTPTTNRVVRRPMIEDLVIPVLLKGETDGEVNSLLEHIDATFNPSESPDQTGLKLTLASTGLPVWVTMSPDVSEVARAGDLWQSELNLRVSGFPVWTISGADAASVQDVEFGEPGQL